MLSDLNRRLRSASRPSPTTAAERGFAAGVADRLKRGPFTYSDRAALLAAGQRLGIGRTRANLIVALAQNGDLRPSPARRPRRRWGLAVVPALVIQTAVVSTGLWAWLA